jgi:hypothetical protein
MKKIILSFLIFMCAGSGSYAYDNGIGLFTGYGSPQTQLVNINSYCEIYFRYSATPGSYGFDGSTYIKHGGSLIHSFNINSYGSSVKYTGYWNTIEVGIETFNGTIGLAELIW